MSVSKIMSEVGYSSAYSKNPHELLNTKSWQVLTEELLSDSYLLKRLKRALNSKNDYVALRALDIAFKLKSRYKVEETGYIDPFSHMTDDELNNEIRRLEKKLKIKP